VRRVARRVAPQRGHAGVTAPPAGVLALVRRVARRVAPQRGQAGEPGGPLGRG
jgi:hypothetical protein